MSVMYNAQNVDEKYAAILEPNLYYGSIFVPGVTCTDKYQIGPAGGIFVHKLSTSAVEVGKPGPLPRAAGHGGGGRRPGADPYGFPGVGAV